MNGRVASMTILILIALGLVLHDVGSAMTTTTAQSSTSLALQLAPAAGRSGGSQTVLATNFTVAGLPVGLQAQLFIDEPAPGGGYFRIQPLGTSPAGAATLSEGQFLEAAPLSISDGERYMPRVRFQSNPGGRVLRFEYEHQFLVMVGRESHGPYDPLTAGRSAGATSAETQWAAAGSVFKVTAIPEGHYQFAQWSVRTRGASDPSAVTHAATLQVVIDRPLLVVATFLGQ